MVRLVLRWLDSPWAFELLPGLNRLGRNPTNDFRVSDPSVSSFHAELVVEDASIRVRDLGSTNGTYLDDRRIDEAILKPENVLRLGNVSFQVEEVTVTPVSPPHHASEPAAGGDIQAFCAHHSTLPAAFKCENCGGGFCAECVTIIGQGRFEATTRCPICNGQCYPISVPPPERAKKSLLARFTQTLKLPFVR